MVGAWHKVSGWSREAGRSVLALALPPRCPGCGVITQRDHEFCLACWSALDFLAGPHCACCGSPFEVDPGEGALCGACHAEPPAFDRMRAAVAYGPIARALALKLKYGRRPGIAQMMARHMRRHLPADDGWLVAPVPLHRWRIWRRGYNQSALMARAVADGTGQMLALDLIERVKATPILRGLGPSGREKAVRGAFRVADRDRVKGRSVLLIDDVYTTGATVRACAQVLRRAGAARISILCWARVVHDETVPDDPFAR